MSSGGLCTTEFPEIAGFHIKVTSFLESYVTARGQREDRR